MYVLRGKKKDVGRVDSPGSRDWVRGPIKLLNVIGVMNNAIVFWTIPVYKGLVP